MKNKLLFITLITILSIVQNNNCMLRIAKKTALGIVAVDIAGSCQSITQAQAQTTPKIKQTLSYGERNALIRAIRPGFFSKLSLKFNLQEQERLNNLLITESCFGTPLEIINLVQQGADIFVKDSKGESVLFQAVKFHNVEAVIVLIEIVERIYPNKLQEFVSTKIKNYWMVDNQELTALDIAIIMDKDSMRYLFPWLSYGEKENPYEIYRENFKKNKQILEVFERSILKNACNQENRAWFEAKQAERKKIGCYLKDGVIEMPSLTVLIEKFEENKGLFSRVEEKEIVILKEHFADKKFSSKLEFNQEVNKVFGICTDNLNNLDMFTKFLIEQYAKTILRDIPEPEIAYPQVL